jgi:membrane AbrB-like protein
MRAMWIALGKLVLTIAIAGAGAAVFLVAHLPSPYLSGGMIAVAIAALAGLPMAMPVPVVRALFVVLGVAIGAGVTPETLRGIVTWPGSMAILALMVVLAVVVSTAFLRRVAGYDRPTALLASVPGALSAVLVTAAQTRADVPRVAVIQNFRLFVLIAVVPSAAGAGVPPQLREAGLMEITGLLAAGALVGWLVERTRLPAGLLIGAMLPSAVLHGSGMLEAQMPAPLAAAAFLGLGAYVGLRFLGISPAILWRTAPAALASFAITMAIALAGALSTWALIGVPLAAALVAFAPGALEGMTALAFSLHLDPAYVGAHHLARFLGITLCLPALAAWMTDRHAGPGAA